LPFPIPSNHEEKVKREALEALAKIKNRIPFWIRCTLRKEFISVESAINKRIQVSQVPNLPVLIDRFQRND
jgi:hypothetical protein